MQTAKSKGGCEFESISFEIWRILGGLFLARGGLQCENLSGLTSLTTKCDCHLLACKFQRLYPNVKAARSESTCLTAELFFALKKNNTENILDATKNFYSIQVEINKKFMDLSLQLHSIASAL